MKKNEKNGKNEKRMRGVYTSAVFVRLRSLPFFLRDSRKTAGATDVDPAARPCAPDPNGFCCEPEKRRLSRMGAGVPCGRRARSGTPVCVPERLCFY
jgi:hypothetical protein